MDSSDDEYVEDISDIGTRSRSSRSRTPGGAVEHGGYSWEDEYKRSWDVVQEDDVGSLATTITGMVEENKRKRRMKDVRPVQRGIIRNLVLVLDISDAMNDTDMRPNRLVHTIHVASEFIQEFFSQNPISQLAIVGIKDGLAQCITPLDGNPDMHIEKLQAVRKVVGSGVPSLQNALDMARAILFNLPVHTTREVLVIYGALMSSDPGPISQTIDNLVSDRIRVGIIGLAAQVAVCQTITSRTNSDKGAYNVVLNEHHFRELFMKVTVPLAISESLAKSSSIAVRMGFPRRTKHSEIATLCSCHGKLTKQGYTCPQCRAKVCSLPMICPVCQLTLILSTHLARSYHHLFPLTNFRELPIEKTAMTEPVNCFGCSVTFEEHHHKYECPKCTEKFCVDCDVFCHDVLHNCPGCEVKPV